MRTKDRLAEALDEGGLPVLADRAREGYYDDFESPYSYPKIELVKALAYEGTEAATSLAQRVKHGDFDNTEEERQAWLNSPKGQAAMRKLLTPR